MQQVLADPKGAPGKPKATADEGTSNLEPLPLRLVTELGHLREDQARLETQLQKLQVQVTRHSCSTLALGHQAQNAPCGHPRLSRVPTPGPLSSSPCSADRESLSRSLITEGSAHCSFSHRRDLTKPPRGAHQSHSESLLWVLGGPTRNCSFILTSLNCWVGFWLQQ